MFHKKRVILLLLAFPVFIAPVHAADEEPGRPEYTIRRRTGKIVIDGVLDDPDWAAAVSLGDFKFPWYNYSKYEEVRKAELEQTEVKMLWDDDFLYVCYTCEDKHIWADHYNSNSRTYRDDCVELFWNPDPASGNAYNMFEINCIGNLLSVYNNFDKNTKLSDRIIMVPHIAQSVRGTVNNDSDIDEGWTIELAIRFDDYPELLKEKPKDGTMWRAGINRCGGRTNWQDSMWAPEFGKIVGNFHLYQYFGKLYFSGERVK
ncbi:MAG: carbohydrate-binding family 9-like protein [Candidatus Latescibacteria bacterium]|nr:carbohydrate-binding family 9-like protein [Candidatus Latescibacterota bacterium]